MIDPAAPDRRIGVYGGSPEKPWAEQGWAIADLNVTPYAETRVFKTIAGDLCRALSDRNQLVLVVKEQRLFFSRPEVGFRCSQL